MEKYVLILKGDKIQIQKAAYIEDGFYIEVIGGDITLFEIPLYGGEEREVGKFNTLIEAFKYAETLT